MILNWTPQAPRRELKNRMNGHLLFSLNLSKFESFDFNLWEIEIKIFRINKNNTPPRKPNTNIFRIRSLALGSRPDDASELMAEANPERKPMNQTNNLVLNSLVYFLSCDKIFNYPFYWRKTTTKHYSKETLKAYK